MNILGGFNPNSSQRRLVLDKNDIAPTLQAAMGSGGNVPMMNYHHRLRVENGF